MKVSTQPMSAFAVYSEKLKQKKKKSKPQVSNGINKIKKAQDPLSNTVTKTKKNADKKNWQMKEIGYILKTLAERSADTTSPRAAALLNSINQANEKLEDNESAFLENTLKNVIVVENLKKKAANLKSKKKAIKNANLNGQNKTNHLNVETPNTESEENCSPRESGFSLSQGTIFEQQVCLKMKKSKVLSKQQDISPNPTVAKTEQSKKKQVVPKLMLKKAKSRNQLQIKPDEKGKRKSQKKYQVSDSTAKKLFEWLIVPVLEKDFMADFWEKKPLLIQREGNRNYFTELLSTEIIDTMLRENNVCFTKHLDVTSYSDGVRETHNLSGRAQANVVWDFYSNGCSVRLLNPQIFLPKIHALNATLQEYFGCFVGANVYLTPPNSQGFAPHYDDIEAFVLQIEGKKHWKVYTPRNEAEVLPRFSSPNFSQEEVGEPFLDVTLEPGDLLYFPRGFIHQASTVEGEHSLHITLSAYQKTAWVDLFEKVLPVALKRAAETDVEFRRGLPRDYLGLEHRGNAREQQRFVDTAAALMNKLCHHLQTSLGAGVDLMGMQFMHDALPPVLLPGEKETSSEGGGLRMKNGKLEGRVEFQIDTSVRLIRHNVCRLVEQEDEVRLYHCLDNSLEYHGEEPQFLVLPPEGVQVVTQLQTSYPAYVPLQDLAHADPEALITLVSDLWDAGLLSAKDLPVVDES